MAYPSVDHLQKVLTKKVFHYAKDSKKAAGRALGTLVEIITIITPAGKRLSILKDELSTLKSKKWQEIHV